MIKLEIVEAVVDVDTAIPVARVKHSLDDDLKHIIGYIARGKRREVGPEISARASAKESFHCTSIRPTISGPEKKISTLCRLVLLPTHSC
jgi:hypothetical protein